MTQNKYKFVNRQNYVTVENTTTGSKIFYPKRGLLVQKMNADVFAFRIDTTTAVYEFEDVEEPEKSGIDELIDEFLEWLQQISETGAGAGGTPNGVAPQTDGFGDTRVAIKRTLLDVKSTFGISNLRDFVEEINGGTVTNNFGPEYELAVSDKDAYVKLRTIQRGEYMSGHSAEAGIGVRIGSSNYKEGQRARWGYFDGKNGFFFEYDIDGLWVNVMRNESITMRKNMNEFNTDRLDGEGPSGFVYDPTKGNIYQINYTWYGYGSINFVLVNSDDEGGFQRANVVHTYTPFFSTSVANPNLPIWVDLDNGDNQGDEQKIYVAGRQYSLYGDPTFRYLRRITSVYRLAHGINQNDGFVPILSIRRKPGYLGNPIRISSFDCVSDARILLQLRVGADLTGESFGDVPDTVQSETAIEVDTSATSLSGGIVIFTEINVSSESGPGNSGSRGGAVETTELTYVLEEDTVITFCAYSYGSSSATVDFLMRVFEGW